MSYIQYNFKLISFDTGGPAMNILLVRPEYPDVKSKKTKNKKSKDKKYIKGGEKKFHHKYFPVGLLKMSTYFKMKGHNVDFVVGNVIPSFVPDKIYITSLFSYWRDDLIKTISYYGFLYPAAEIFVGGIDASLNSADISKYGVNVIKGIMHEVENLLPDYSYLDKSIDYQVIHTTRSCIRACNPCGATLIDGVDFIYKELRVVENEIFMNKVTFYDNNLLAHPQIKDILRMIEGKRVNGKVISKVESKSGFDARLLVKDWNDTLASGGRPEDTLAYLIKKARFINPRIAWDNDPVAEEPIVKKAIELFLMAGYKSKDIQVFMIYNFDLPFKIMEYKRIRCAEWGIQIADCRFRPLNSTFDNYNPKVSQTSKDYFIHPNWNDELVKLFRKKVRGQNIVIRFLAKDRPIDIAKFQKYNVPDSVLKEFCSRYPWQEDSKDSIHRPLVETLSA